MRVDGMHAKDLRGMLAIAAGSLLMHLVQNCAALGIRITINLARGRLQRRSNGSETYTWDF